MRFKPRRSSPRLYSFDYTGSYAYHLVLTTKDRALRFQEATIVAICLECLQASAGRYGFNVAAYCFMPDHVHLLVSGNDTARLVRFVQHFKQATARRYPGLWQRSFYDHVLRRDEVLEDIAFYIWGNPVRAGLVEDAVAYPYSGPREALMGYERGWDTGKGGASAYGIREKTGQGEAQS